ncbi:MAG: GntR family transcriptional regulator, partial [Vulcanimicrobiaceae bacterium]
MELDPRDRRPLYVQIADDVVARIERGELTPGDRLPGMRELAARLGCGLVTVSQAYDVLATRGRVLARVGKGTFVAAPRELEPPPVERRWEPEIGGVVRARMEGLLDRLAHAHRPGAVSLASGHPAPETFPLLEFGRCLERTLVEDPPAAMQYATPYLGQAQAGGDPDLRAALAASLRERGVAADPADLVVCSGAQQAADIVAATLL